MKLSPHFTDKVLQTLSKRGVLRCPNCGWKADFTTIQILRPNLDEQDFAFLLESLEYNSNRKASLKCIHAFFRGVLLSFPDSKADSISEEWTADGLLLKDCE